MQLRKVTSLVYAGLMLCASTTCSIPNAEKIEFNMISQFNTNDKIKDTKNMDKELTQIKTNEENERKAREEQERLLQEEIKRQEQLKQEEIKLKGRRVKFHITYYTNANNSLEGGHKDKKSKYLTNHDYPVLALPSDVKYGSKVVFDEVVNGSNEYVNVDTGGAIVWLNDEKTECKADVFIADVSEKWIERNMKNKIVYGYLK